MEALIESAEARRHQAERALADPQTYSLEPQRVPEWQRQLDESAGEVDWLYARWQELQDLLHESVKRAAARAASMAGRSSGRACSNLTISSAPSHA